MFAVAVAVLPTFNAVYVNDDSDEVGTKVNPLYPTKLLPSLTAILPVRILVGSVLANNLVASPLGFVVSTLHASAVLIKP